MNAILFMVAPSSYNEQIMHIHSTRNYIPSTTHWHKTPTKNKFIGNWTLKLRMEFNYNPLILFCQNGIPFVITGYVNTLWKAFVICIQQMYVVKSTNLLLLCVVKRNFCVSHWITQNGGAIKWKANPSHTHVIRIPLILALTIHISLIKMRSRMVHP